MVAASLLFLTACGSAEPVALPDVVGLRLDDARDALRDLGFEEVDYVDRLEDRSVFSASNWVVVDQSPAGGAPHLLDDEVAVGVVKLDDPGTAERVDEDSPNWQEVMKYEEAARQRAAEDAADKAAEEARRQQEAEQQAQQGHDDLVSYVEDLDPAMLLAKQMIEGMDEFADLVAGGLSEADFRLGADLVNDTMDRMASSMEGVAPPASTGRAESYRDLEEAAEDFSRAANTLLSASGSTREQSLARYETIWSEATASWNSALAELYEGTGIEPPTIQP